MDTYICMQNTKYYSRFSCKYGVLLLIFTLNPEYEDIFNPKACDEVQSKHLRAKAMG